MPDSVPSYASVGEIARRLGVAVHRVEWLVRTRNLKPIGRVGHFRVFSDADVAYIKSESDRIDAERGTR